MNNINNNLPTVTIAISAYNEEDNIIPFLKSVLAQRNEGYLLQEILVYSDGSTDQTVEKAISLNNPLIKVIADSNRLGKSSRLNEIYQSLDSDILVQSDADVIFAHPNVVRDIIQPLLKEENVAMCGGHPQPSPAVTFTEKAVNCTFEAYAPLRKNLRGGNNIFSVDGRILSYKKDLVKKIQVPKDMTANDAFTYLCCLTYGYQYRYVSSAVVIFRSPQTIRDQIKQNTRFLASPIKMCQHFPKTLVLHERHIPVMIHLSNMGIIFIKHPVLCSYIYLINLYCRIWVIIAGKTISAKWKMALSTKKF